MTACWSQFFSRHTLNTSKPRTRWKNDLYEPDCAVWHVKWRICGESYWLGTSSSTAVTFSLVHAQLLWFRLGQFLKTNISQGNVATSLRCGGVYVLFRHSWGFHKEGVLNDSGVIKNVDFYCFQTLSVKNFHCKFPAESTSERILTISEYLTKTCTRVRCVFWLTVYYNITTSQLLVFYCNNVSK